MYFRNLILHFNIGTEESGKAAACQGCPNQKICEAAGPAKPDPDVKFIAGKSAF